MTKITRVRTGCWTCKRRYVFEAFQRFKWPLTTDIANVMKENPVATTVYRQIENARATR